MQRTNISWADFSSNPLRATNRETGKAGHFCEKVSPGCAKCYASEWNEKRYGTGLAFLPANRERVDFWLNERELAEWQKPKYAGRKVFVADMTDLFAEWVPDEWLDRIFGAMEDSCHPRLTPMTPMTPIFQVLTKRPERMRQYLSRRWTGAYLPQFIWLGVSVENQRWADERIPLLLDTPAAGRFISAEPLLGPVDLGDYVDGLGWHLAKSLDWVVCGGESGPRRRPMRLEWLESVVAQCQAAGVAVFCKQDGALRPGQQGRISDELWALKELPLAPEDWTG